MPALPWPGQGCGPLWRSGSRRPGMAARRHGHGRKPARVRRPTRPESAAGARRGTAAYRPGHDRGAARAGSRTRAGTAARTTATRQRPAQGADLRGHGVEPSPGTTANPAPPRPARRLGHGRGPALARRQPPPGYSRIPGLATAVRPARIGPQPVRARPRAPVRTERRTPLWHGGKSRAGRAADPLGAAAGPARDRPSHTGPATAGHWPGLGPRGRDTAWAGSRTGPTRVTAPRGRGRNRPE
jgi:hypothetical protein